MKLTFHNEYKSISSFPEVDLPHFCVVIGINGSGKTQLLESIKSGSIRNDVTKYKTEVEYRNNEQSIKYINNSKINISFNVSPINSLENNLDRIYANFISVRENRLIPYLQKIEKITGKHFDKSVHGSSVWQFGPSKIAEFYGKKAYEQEIIKIFEEANEDLMGDDLLHDMRARGPDPLADVRTICKKTGSSILSITPEQINFLKTWGDQDQFAINLADIFHKYRDAQLQHWMLEASDKHIGTNISISQEEFIATFKQPPWDLINETLKSFSLPYEVSAPYLTDSRRTNIAFRRSIDKTEITFDDLSSGEKILVQFAISSFQFDETFMTIRRPKILLLDEMDSSLHPEMTKRWLRAIENVLVKEQGITCILTTHSPTTVALSPDESLYEMRGGDDGIVKLTKQDALNKLTFGVPTLSIDYQNRRQVFAESDTDAEIYERIYSIIKSHIYCPVELNFLSTGIRNNKEVEINSGCDIVNKLVSQLVISGNRSVYGIVDWDGKTSSTDRIKVIAEGKRDGIENVLLDPLLICLLLMKNRKAPSCLNDINRFVNASHLDTENIQRLVDAVQIKLLGCSELPKVEVQYMSGMTAFVYKEYLQMDDHLLEEKLCQNFEFLNKWKKGGRGKLVKAVIDEVIMEHTMFCPVEIKDIFESLSKQE